MKIYNSGKFILHKEGPMGAFFRRLWEYLTGVTIARQRINRKIPALVERIDGDILDIGGYHNFFKKRYKKGAYINLDVTSGPEVDIVENAEKLESFEDNSLGGVFCISVLEHAKKPALIIGEIHRCLKPGGTAYISTPWLFETHMEPHDYWRFSRFQCEKQLGAFSIEEADYTNSYWGNLAHVMQHHIFLRVVFGIGFFILDYVSRNDSRWATQVSYVVKKPID